MRRVAPLLVALALAGRAAAVTLPATLRDVHGAPVDVARLASRHRLVVVTVKAPWCGVCRAQLARLREELPRLRACGATFLVLGPGPAAELRAVAEATGFPYPFVEDPDLALGRALDLVLAPGQLVPAVLVADAARRVVWVDRGRAPGAFNDAALLSQLGCPPDRMARSGR